MAVPSDPVSSGDGASTLQDRLKSALVTGIALTIPLLVTAIVVAFVVNLVATRLAPVVETLIGLVGLDSTTTVVLGAHLATILGIVVLWIAVGLAVQTDLGRRIEVAVDDLIERLPGVGSVYSSFNQMSELLLQSDSRSFREVVLVEYPHEGAYSLAFLTADQAAVIGAATDNDAMRAVFMPMAPNPFMGGFVLYLAEEDVYEVDLTVEEGIQAVVTSGVAIADDVQGTPAAAAGVEPPDDAADA